MTRDALIEMARAAGLHRKNPVIAPEVITFAVMVSSFERERCAALVDPKPPAQPSDHEWLALERAARRIRGD
jgi:hypothetical protein